MSHVTLKTCLSHVNRLASRSGCPMNVLLVLDIVHAPVGDARVHVVKPVRHSLL